MVGKGHDEAKHSNCAICSGGGYFDYTYVLVHV